MDFFFSAGILVHFALLFYALGFLVRDELWLRGLILIGTFFYISYYYFIADAPLWDAIFTSSVLATINIGMICLLITERTTFAMSTETAAAFKNFPTLTPGQFRKMMKKGTAHTVDQSQQLCRAGFYNKRLFLLVEGTGTLTKAGTSFPIAAPMFIGEVGFLNQGPASADIELDHKARYLAWETTSLRKMMDKSAPMKNALIALFSSDLAGKVGRSSPIQNQSTPA